MINSGKYHGGLVFFGCDDTMLDRFARIVSATLEDYGHPVERQSVMNAHEGRITSTHYGVKLDLAQGASASDHAKRRRKLDCAGNLNPGQNDATQDLHRLQIDLSAVDPTTDDTDISELLMVVMLYRIVDICEVTGIEWLDPNTTLTLGQFLAAFTDAGPTRVRGRQEILDDNIAPFGAVHNTAHDFDAMLGQMPHSDETGLIELAEEEALALAYRAEPHPDVLEADALVEEAQSDIRRLATWGMTGMLVFLSGPVALSMAAVNLARGEDFRLNTQVLSLTGLLVSLQSSGALSSAVALLPL